MATMSTVGIASGCYGDNPQNCLKSTGLQQEVGALCDLSTDLLPPMVWILDPPKIIYCIVVDSILTRYSLG